METHLFLSTTKSSCASDIIVHQLVTDSKEYALSSGDVLVGSAMLLEEQRFLHEDLERLEQAISDRVSDDPRQVSCRWQTLAPVSRHLKTVT